MVSTGKTLRPFLIKQWPALAGAAAATVCLTAAELAKPWPLKLVIDELFAGSDDGFSLTGSDLRLLAGIAVLVVAIAMLDAGATFASNLWLQRAGERINHELRVAVYAHLQRLSLGFHQRRQKGDLVTRVTGDVNAVGALFADTLGPMTQATLLLVGILVVSLLLDPLLALVAFSTTPVLAILSFRYRRKVRAAARSQRWQEGEIASIANEALSAMPVVKAFGSEHIEHGRVERRSERRMDLGVAVARLQARFEGLIGVLSAVGTALVIVVAVLRVAAGAISPGDLVVFASYARKINSPLRSIARQATNASRGLARADRIAELLAADEVLEDRPGAYRGGRAAGKVDAERVSFAYEPGRPVVRDVSLQVPSGSCVALVGASGSGKSTLGALLARFYDPTSGRVMLDGRDTRDCSVAWLRGQIGVLLQDTVLFTGTVAENIGYGADATRDEVVAAARAAAADRFVEALPDGYDTPLGPQGGGLSGGQRQRIGIARTLLRDPAVLILDEPTTGLDSDSQAQVVQGLFRLMEGRTTILITHSLELARAADRFAVLDAGRVIREGPGEELVAERGVLERLARERRRPRRVPAAPVDAALPKLRDLLDGDRMTRPLARSLGREARVEKVTVRRVRYKPGRRLIVHYGASVDGEPHDAVATALAEVDLAARARKLGGGELARALGERSPARVPVHHADEVDAIVSWLPFDPALPALALSPAELARRMRARGVAVQDTEEPRVLGYKPGARAVLRLDGHVLKAYGKERQFTAALSGLRAAAAADWVRTPVLEANLPELQATVQSAIPGGCPATAVSAAGAAGDFARRLHRSSLDQSRSAPPEFQLSEAARHAQLAGAISPELRPRLDQLLAELTAGVPAGLKRRPAHGDLHVDQLLLDGDELAIVDFDELCAAPPALDLATFAADVVRGRGDDLAALSAVVEPLLEAYGERPPGFEWYLVSAIVCRCTHPFRSLVAGWPERIEGTVQVAEEVLAR